MKKILGLDLGTNSIGWALIEQDFDKKEGKIVGMGSRIVPMSQDVLGKFDSGQSVSQTAERTGYRGVRRLYQRDNLRRERLHRVLNVLGFLPTHYALDIDFEKHLGQFKKEKEPKINYKRNENGEFQFLFKSSFDEMVADFNKAGYTGMIPYDWTIYYLRKKALRHKVTKEELAWIILHFNQKRGYYQLRGDDDMPVDDTKQEEFHALQVVDVQATDDTNAKGVWYNVVLENGWVYRRQSKDPLFNWIGKIKEFIVTTQLEADGTEKKDKEGNVSRSFRAVDSEKDWIAIKTKTEQKIEKSQKTVGEFIYEALLENPKQKIRGKLVRTIERKFYKEELKVILKTQVGFHDELQSNKLFQACLSELYPKNEGHIRNIRDKGFVHLFLDDIIFYQRPLKSQKSSIHRCSFEYRVFNKEVKVEENGNTIVKKIKTTEGIHAIPKSHPLYQEFRLWQFLGNLRIYKLDLAAEVDVTRELLQDEDDYVKLFEYLNFRKEVEQKNIIEYFERITKQIAKSEKENYRWNYVEDKKYPCNETRSSFISKLKLIEGIDLAVFLTTEREIYLWHIIYSVKDKVEYEKALKTFAKKNQVNVDSFFEAFKRFKPFDNEYGAYSFKALTKLLPLMRMGKYWSKDDIHKDTLERIDKLLTGEFDEKIADRVREKSIKLERLSDFRGLPIWLASYVVYNRHSESATGSKWSNPEDIDMYLREFKQHSLRNPIVEQVVTETLRTVRDIWQIHGNGIADYFKEIHIELGREMKNPSDKRKQLAAKITENENTNQRIRELLTELMNDEYVQGNVRPYSPSHQEILKIYEEGVYQNPDARFDTVSIDEIEKIRKNNSPSQNEIRRYKLWLEQGYRSPYTGEMIPLSRLFTIDYQIEHVIPQARYFDDSLSNKVICESEVNQLKGSMTAYEFIKNPVIKTVTLNGGKVVNIMSLDEYVSHCNHYFKNNRVKLKKLLSEDIPEGFIERQLNDSRYISKLVKSLLSNIVKEADEVEATSKNIVPVTGAITSKLKQDWGLNDKWNEIVAPRFIRLNKITQTNDYGYFDQSINAFRCEVPDDLKRGFNKKRIDHRHHALDALIIACTTKDHVNYITSLNTNRTNYGLVSKFRKMEEKQITDRKNGVSKVIKVPTDYLLPWSTFPVDALIHLQKIIVSFKQNLRVINKTNNRTWQWVEKHGLLKKELVKQTKGDNWAIRKPMHKETVSGFVRIQVKKEVSFTNGIKDWESLVDDKLKSKIRKLVVAGIKEKDLGRYFKENPYLVDGAEVKKVEVYTYTNDATASRIALSEKFTRKQLESVTDSGIRKILENHVKNYVNSKGVEQFDLAFNADGIDELNANIVTLNNGKFHQPIYKVRIYEEGKKFPVGHVGNKSSKFVEAAKGTNLFFAVSWNEEKQKREFETVPLNVVIAHQKQVAHLPKEERTPVPINSEKGQFLFVLSPNDLVYVPTEEELSQDADPDLDSIDNGNSNRVYKMVSSSGNQCFFIQNCVSVSIANKIEFSSLNKMERDINENMIKEICWKLEIDRLGRVTKIIR